MSSAHPKTRSVALILGVGIAITAVNMRAAIGAVSPLLETIREDTGLSTTVAGLITTLPVVCFGLLSGIAPRLARRFGIDLMIWLTMAGLTAGIVVRLAEPVFLLFLGTVIIGASIALANVLVPAVIKRDFPERTGLMTGIYTMGIAIGGSVAAGLMVPINERGLPWRQTLALLALPALVAVLAQLPRLLLNRDALAHAAARRTPAPRLWRNRLAWQVSLFMGLQSAVFFGMAAWIPAILYDAGLSREAAGTMWALCNLAGLPFSLAVPLVAQRLRDQRPILVVVIAVWAVAIIGLLVAPATATLLWMALLGAASGSALSLALMLIVLRSPDAAHAAALSGMAQAIGYCLAATAPFLVGALRDLTGGWEVSVTTILIVLVPTLFAGWMASRRALVGPPPDAATPVLRRT